jgi:hypothetical protein
MEGPSWSTVRISWPAATGATKSIARIAGLGPRRRFPSGSGFRWRAGSRRSRCFGTIWVRRRGGRDHRSCRTTGRGDPTRCGSRPNGRCSEPKRLRWVSGRIRPARRSDDRSHCERAVPPVTSDDQHRENGAGHQADYEDEDVFRRVMSGGDPTSAVRRGGDRHTEGE